MSTDVQRLSQQRDDIYDWCTDRFKELLADDDHDSALAIADEFFEWLNPDQMDEEETLYYNERELLEHSLNSMQNESQISDELRQLILSYMEAYTNDNHAMAETYLHQIRQLKEDNP